LDICEVPDLWQPPDWDLPSLVRVCGGTRPRLSSDGHHGVAGHRQGVRHKQEVPLEQDLACLC
jgi:hypothetical protein